jgi:hypothetical protein
LKRPTSYPHSDLSHSPSRQPLSHPTHRPSKQPNRSHSFFTTFQKSKKKNRVGIQVLTPPLYLV